MKVATRRAIMAVAGAAGGAAVAATVAAVVLWRKPAGPVVATLVPEMAVQDIKVGDITSLVPANPPRELATATFHDAEGATLTLADYAGRGLVVNLWATWCAPCVAEMPELQSLARLLAGEGILVLPLSSDRGGAAVVRRFYESHRIEALPILLDPKGAAARAWGVRGLPTTLIIDRQGREQGRVEGGIDWASDATIAVLRRLVG